MLVGPLFQTNSAAIALAPRPLGLTITTALAAGPLSQTNIMALDAGPSFQATLLGVQMEVAFGLWHGRWCTHNHSLPIPNTSPSQVPSPMWHNAKAVF